VWYCKRGGVAPSRPKRRNYQSEKSTGLSLAISVQEIVKAGHRATKSEWKLGDADTDGNEKGRRDLGVAQCKQEWRIEDM